MFAPDRRSKTTSDTQFQDSHGRVHPFEKNQVSRDAIQQTSDMFRDRHEAAQRLAEKLKAYRGKHPLILAIPRGAVPMAKIIADKLGGDLDVVLVRKLRAPHQPELAIGSVNESGWTYQSDYAELYGADAGYLEAEKRLQMDTIRQRRAQYTPVRPPIDPAGRIVIVIDDGLATGATMISALHGLRASQPAKLICAVPVSPPDTLLKVAELADEVVCLEAPAFFQAVGQFYQYFPQVDDDEVIGILQKS
jgi:predicted phosphoribosyltransferase